MSRITLADVVIDALVGALRDRTGWRAPTDQDAAASQVTVFDGPEVLLSGDPVGSFVVIGYGGESVFEPGDEGDDSSRGDVSVRAIATTSPKDEESTIDCLAVFQSGDLSVSAARTAVMDIAAGVDTTLRTDPKIGVAVSGNGQLFWTQVTGWALRTYIRGGIVAELRFSLSFKART